MSKLDKDSVIEKFTQAYKAANGKEPTIEAKGGWYSVDGGKNMRLAQLDEMADSLGADAPKAEAKKAAPKKAEAAEKKPAAKKAPAKKAAPKAKKKSTSFSVKDFYAQEILASKPGSRKPR